MASSSAISSREERIKQKRGKRILIRFFSGSADHLQGPYDEVGHLQLVTFHQVNYLLIATPKVWTFDLVNFCHEMKFTTDVHATSLGEG